MQDFLAALDQHLMVLASTPAAEAVTSAPRRRRRRPLLAGAATALVAGAGVLTMTGTSTAELPILATPTTDESALRTRIPAAAEAGVDFSAAHRFSSPGGPGYVLVGLENQAVCLIVPDPDAPGSFGTSCAKSIATVRRDGLQAEFPGDLGKDADAKALSVFVLPDGAKDVRLSSRGTNTTPHIESGVAVTELAHEARLRWTVDGRPASKLLEGPFPALTRVEAPCPDGRTVHYPLPPTTTPREEFNAALRAAAKKACAR